MFVLSLLVSGLAWWLGLCLLARDPGKPLLWWAGLGLLGYAAAVVVPHPVLLGVPALAWTGAILLLAHQEWIRWWIFAGGAVLRRVGLGAVGRAAPARRRICFSLVGVMFGLSAAAFLLQLLPNAVTLPMIGVDLVVFGVQVALFSGSVELLFTTVAAAIAVQVLANPLAAVVDRLAVPSVASERAELRAVAESLPRRAPLITDDPAEFARLTRKALSHYGDLGTRPAPNRATVLMVIIGNTVWAVASVLVAELEWFPLTSEGTVLVLLQAAAVLGFAVLQFIGLRQRSGATSASDRGTPQPSRRLA